MQIAVVGANGQLGAATVREWRLAGHDVHPLTRADVDITNRARVLELVSRLAPALVINCTAYNRVDDAEGSPSEALAVNAWAVRSLARAAAQTGAAFVHYSTDFVFDGCSDRPYTEDDAPNPQSAYGASKLLGEWFALNAGRTEGVRTGLEGRHYVLRVESLFGGAAARSSIDRMLETMLAGGTVHAFNDRTVSPSYVHDVAVATRRLAETAAPSGLYHCVNTGHVTWLELAQHLATLAGRPAADIRGVPAASAPLRAKRPQFAALSNAKLAAAGIVMPTWRDALRRHLA